MAGIAEGICATESSKAALIRQGLKEMSTFCREFDKTGAFQVWNVANLTLSLWTLLSIFLFYCMMDCPIYVCTYLVCCNTRRTNICILLCNFAAAGDDVPIMWSGGPHRYMPGRPQQSLWSIIYSRINTISWKICRTGCNWWCASGWPNGCKGHVGQSCAGSVWGTAPSGSGDLPSGDELFAKQAWWATGGIRELSAYHSYSSNCLRWTFAAKALPLGMMMQIDVQTKKLFVPFYCYFLSLRCSKNIEKKWK